MTETLFDVKVGGPYACFSRPEFKVERVSYLIMTPSAARGILEAVFWKPEIRWEIREIWLLAPIRQTSILRNEISSRQGGTPFFIEDRRQQRQSLILKDVAYLIRAALITRPHATEPLAKYTDQVRRRLEKGQYFHHPYLGAREFDAWFEPATGTETPIKLDLDLGQMLFDIAYRPNPKRAELTFHRHGANGRSLSSGYAEPLFFHARLNGGVLEVPPELYQELYRLEGAYA